MDERKGDPRIYIVTILFFSCIVSGGVFLCLYIFLNANNVKPWYPYVGMILVGIPWVFWLFAYIYRCFRPDETGMQPSKSSMRSMPANTEASGIAHANSTSEKSPVISPRSSDGKRHVHFGGVVVISENGNGSGGNDHEGNEGMEGSNNTASHERKDSGSSRESEMPLNLSVSS